MSTQDVATWRRLDPDQQALSLFNAWAIYSGTKLICTAVAELLTSFQQEIPSDIKKWNVEQEDFIRSFGKRCAERIGATIQSEIKKTLEVNTQARTSGLELPLGTPNALPVMQKALTIHDRVRPLVELLKQRARERREEEDTGFEGVSYEELKEALGEEVALVLDIALDYGFVKPTNLISTIGNSIMVQRGYKDTERDADPESNSPGPSQLVEQRLVSAVHLLCHNFESCNRGDSLHQLAFNKFLVNVQANLAKGKINLSDRGGINHILTREVAREFGPMAYTAAALTPTSPVPIVSFLHDKGIIKNLIDDEEKSLSIVLTRPTKIEQALISFQEAWSPDEEKVIKDVRLLCELHAERTLGQGIPTKGNLLTALAACSSEQRYVYYGFNLVRIWSASASMVMNRLREKIRSEITEADVKPDLTRMLRAGASFSDKTKWYITLADWRDSIERVNVEPDLLMAKRRLLGRIEQTPHLQREGICRSVIDVESLIRLVGTLLRYAVTQAGLVTGSELAKKPEGAQPRDGFQPTDVGVAPRNFAEVCIMLRVQAPIEIEKAQTALDRVASLSDKAEINDDVLRDLTHVWDTVRGIINDTEQTIRKKGYKFE